MALVQWAVSRQAQQHSYQSHYRRKESERQVAFWIRVPATRSIHIFSLVLSFKIMESTRIRSAGVTTAAALVVMGSSCALFVWAFFFVPMINYQDHAGKHFYQTDPFFFAVMALVPPLLIALG